MLSLAAEKEIETFALTDHDTVDGLVEAQDVADREDIKLVPGTELTCYWNNRIVHIIGLGIDTASKTLIKYLDGIRQLREERSLLIAQRLKKKGLPDVLELAEEYAGGGQIGRPHFARALVAAGAVNSEQQAFKQWLGAGKIGDVKVEWPQLQQSVESIKESGGFAVIAHPTKYKFTFTKIRSLADDFLAVGGDGIEVAYPGLKPNHLSELSRLAEQRGLLVSAGSDFHNPQWNWTGLGKFPRIEVDERHILSKLV